MNKRSKTRKLLLAVLAVFVFATFAELFISVRQPAFANSVEECRTLSNSPAGRGEAPYDAAQQSLFNRCRDLRVNNTNPCTTQIVSPTRAVLRCDNDQSSDPQIRSAAVAAAAACNHLPVGPEKEQCQDVFRGHYANCLSQNEIDTPQMLARCVNLRMNGQFGVTREIVNVAVGAGTEAVTGTGDSGDADDDEEEATDDPCADGGAGGNTPVPEVTIGSGNNGAWTAWLNDTGIPFIKEWYPQIADRIAAGQYTTPTHLTVRVTEYEDDGSIAYVEGEAMTIRTSWLSANLNSFQGVIIHEIVHLAQQHNNGTPTWITEGIADNVRHYMFPQVTNGGLQPPTEHYTEGYEPAAYLLEYIARNHGPNFIRDLNVAMHNGESSDAFIMARTNKSFETHWNEMKAGGATITGPAAAAEADVCTEDNVPDCRVKHTMGAIVCPVYSTLADASDVAFAFLSDNFLAARTDVISSETTYQAWQRFRDIANVFFVFAFLLVVYSQISNMGMTNYGIKKLLPKLILVAVLVNMSYFICQLMVDISNYLGYTLAQFFGEFLMPTIDEENKVVTDTGGAGSMTVIIASVLAGGLFLLLTLAGSVLLPAVLALLLIVLILISRQALIVLLIVIAPLAFAAYLLPNTENLFKKWWKMFYTLLLLFPVVGLIFGASRMVSMLLMPEMPPEGEELPEDFDYIMAFIAFGVATVPFFAVPSVLKGSLKAAGSLGAKLESMTNKQAHSASSAMNATARERFANSSIGRGIASRKNSRQLFKDKRFAQKMADKGWRGKMTRLMAQGPPIPEKVPDYITIGGSQIPLAAGARFDREAVARQAQAGFDSAEYQEIAAESAMLGKEAIVKGRGTNPDGTPRTSEDYLREQLTKAVQTGNSIRARAAYTSLLESGEGGVDMARRALQENYDAMEANGMNATMQQYIRQNHSDIKARDLRQMNYATSGERESLYHADLSTLNAKQAATQTAQSVRDFLDNPTYSNAKKTATADRVLGNTGVSKDMKGRQRSYYEPWESAASRARREAINHGADRQRPPTT